MNYRSINVALLVALAVPALGSAQQVNTRTQLNGILTSSATEGFESFTMPGSGPPPFLNAGPLGTLVLDNSTISPFGGPVVSGIRFSTTARSGLQMNGPGYYGGVSNNINANGAILTVTFLNFVQAFGLTASDWSPYAAPFSATVFGPGNTLLGTMLFPGANAPLTEFVGWQDASGIDHVDFSRSTQFNVSTTIDDVQFGTTFAVVGTPEPASMALLATGLIGVIGVARRRQKKAAA
jgi:hypothetical protein